MLILYRSFPLFLSLLIVALLPLALCAAPQDLIGPPKPESRSEVQIQSVPEGKLESVQSEDIYTLERCISEALESNDRILTALEKVKEKEASEMIARAVLYPRLFVNTTIYMADQNLMKSDREFRDEWNVSFELSKRLFSAGADAFTIKAAELDKNSEWLSVQKVVNEVIYEVRIAFYEALLFRSEIDIRKQQVELLTKEVDRQKSLFEAGRSTRFNILRTEVRLSTEKPQLERAGVEYLAAKIELFDLMNAPGLTLEKLNKSALKGELNCPSFDYSEDDLIEIALAGSPEIDYESKQELIHRYRAQSERRSQIPRLDAFLATTTKHNEGVKSFFDAEQDLLIGVRGTWNVFDGLEGKGKAEREESLSRQSKIRKIALGRRIENAVRKAFISYDQAKRALDTQVGNIEKAKEAISLAESSVEAGLSTQFEVLQATVDLKSAQNQELQTKLDYHRALAELERLAYIRVNMYDDRLLKRIKK